MASRVIARKAARLIPISRGEEPYFDPRGDIPFNSANTAQALAGYYRAVLVGIFPVANRTPTSFGGLPHQHVYAWVYRTLGCRENWLLEDGLDEEGEAYEVVHYTATEIGDPIGSLTRHVGGMIGEVPDPEVLEAVGLSSMIGSKVRILVKHGSYAVPSLKAEIAWYGEADHLRRGPHMVGVVGGVNREARPQSGWRKELEAAARRHVEEERPTQVAVLKITDAEED